jgi:two-component system NarL family sensor kinase
LLNLWIPNSSDITIATTANRVVAAMALLVTGFLSDRNRSYQDAIAKPKIQILAKEELMRLREDFTSTIPRSQNPAVGSDRKLKCFSAREIGSNLDRPTPGDRHYGSQPPKQPAITGNTAGHLWQRC